jgi:hypothetical protein
MLFKTMGGAPKYRTTKIPESKNKITNSHAPVALTCVVESDVIPGWRWTGLDDFFGLLFEGVVTVSMRRRHPHSSKIVQAYFSRTL